MFLLIWVSLTEPCRTTQCSLFPQPLVLVTKVALECLLDRQKWRCSTVQRLRKPGWMVHQQDDPRVIFGFFWEWRTVKDPPAIILWRILWKTPENLRPFYSKPMICVFGTRQAPTSYQNYLPPMRWHPESPEAPKTLAIWSNQRSQCKQKRPTCTSQKVTAGFPEKMMGETPKFGWTGSSPKIPREGPTATISPFSGEL